MKCKKRLQYFRCVDTSRTLSMEQPMNVKGPMKCSGLEVARYDASAIAAELGEGFRLLEQVDETHTTPWGTEQKFSYFRFAPSATATATP